jgi:hypothetical protein
MLLQRLMIDIIQKAIAPPPEFINYTNQQIPHDTSCLWQYNYHTAPGGTEIRSEVP